MHKMNNTKILTLVILFGLTTFSHNLAAQKYFSRTGEITFFSESPVENIEAASNTASTVIDPASGQIQWAVLVKSFEFKKALMQEHFNENYMESSKYPKAKFSGTISNMSDINLSKDGEYNASITGTLEIHGVVKDVTSEAVFTVVAGQITAKSELSVLVEDFDIKIPVVVKDNIAKEIDIKIHANYELLDKS
jgi:polyisoprenoid-binding protein YceI